jgi:TPR repeat protein
MVSPKRLWFRLIAVAMLLAPLAAIAQDDAVRQLQSKVEVNDADAECTLALRYEKGDGVKRDIHKALDLYRKAGMQGTVRAQRALGHLLESGSDGSPVDKAEAAKWYESAGVQGDTESQKALGRMYGAGEGVPKDDIASCKWWFMAAGANDPEGIQQYQRLSKILTPDQASRAMMEADYDLHPEKYHGRGLRSGGLQGLIFSPVGLGAAAIVVVAAGVMIARSKKRGT